MRLMGWGLAAGWTAGRLSWPRTAVAGNDREVRLALLADAHLIDGDDRRPAARALARAVAEIRALTPAPDLVLFAGDLAHQADPRALALGQEILSDLPAPLFLVMGEGDGLPDTNAAWRRLFGDPWFSQTLNASRYPGGPSPSPPPSPPRGERGNFMDYSGQNLSNLLPKTANRKPQTGIQVLGLHTSWCPGPGGPGFNVGEAGRRWLARELARLNPDAPLVVLSHAPLARVFRPWQQWTGDAPEIMQLLAGFQNVFCLHGHVHRHEGISANFAKLGQESPPPLAGGGWGEEEFSTPTLTLPPQGGGEKAGFARPIICLQGLPATAWPRPLALQGTPAAPGPGLGPHGCGWALASINSANLQFQPRLWQA